MRKLYIGAFPGVIIIICLFLQSLAIANTQGRVSLSQQSFVSPDYKSTDKTNFQFVGVGVDTLAKARKESDIEDSLHAQIMANIAPGSTVLNYLNVSQLFWKQNALILGRKKLNWSEIDDSFQLGIYQPNFSWNVLAPESQGLTGLFLKVEPEQGETPMGIYLFASNIFIPDQGAGYEIKDGKFEKSNPYFQSPPTHIEVNGQTDNINYNVQKPRTEDILFSRSFAAKAYLGDNEQGAFIQAAYANKPANQLDLGFQGAITPNNSVAVQILPAIYYHRLVSADAQYLWGSAANGSIGLGISALSETLEDPSYSSEWTYAKYSNSQMLSPFMKAQYKGFKAKFAYLQITGAEKTAEGPQASLAEKILVNRFPFSNAYLADLSYRYRIRRYQGLVFSTRYLTGEKSEFALVSARASYQWEERWSAYLDSQLAAVDNTPAGEKISYHSYMNNDMASVGVQHVF